jgi:hypothetical protein
MSQLPRKMPLPQQPALKGSPPPLLKRYRFAGTIGQGYGSTRGDRHQLAHGQQFGF